MNNPELKTCYNCDIEVGSFDCTIDSRGLYLCNDCLKSEYDGKAWYITIIEINELSYFNLDDLKKYIAIHFAGSFENMVKSYINREKSENEKSKVSLAFVEAAQKLFSTYYQLSLDI